MKQYKVTVNGQSFDVSVEEMGASAAPRLQVANTSAPAAPSAAPLAPVSASSAAPVVSSSSASAGAISVKASMPGTVMSFKVTVGQEVKRGDVLLILEAMKMENEIVAPQAGKVAALRVPVSASVNTNDPLVDLE